MLRLELIDLFARNEGVEFTQDRKNWAPYYSGGRFEHSFNFVFNNHEDATTFIDKLNAHLKDKGYRRLPMPTMKYRFKKVKINMKFRADSDHEKPLTPNA